MLLYICRQELFHNLGWRLNIAAIVLCERSKIEMLGSAGHLAHVLFRALV